MSAIKKITEAENILIKLQELSSNTEFQLEVSNFIKTIYDAFSHLLNEYNKKFGLSIDRISFEKFKIKAKKLGNINAINFLIWYEKEYRKIKDDKICGYLLDRTDNLSFDISNSNTIINACSLLLNKTRTLAYNAYENF